MVAKFHRDGRVSYCRRTIGRVRPVYRMDMDRARKNLVGWEFVPETMEGIGQQLFTLKLKLADLKDDVTRKVGEYL